MPLPSGYTAQDYFIRGAGSYPGEPPAGYDEYKKREKYAPTQKKSVDEVRMPAAAFKYALDAIASKPGVSAGDAGGFAGRGGRSFGFRGSPAGQGGRGPFGATAAPRAFRGRLGLTGGGQHASARNNAANLQVHHDEQVTGDAMQGVEEDLPGLDDDDEEPILYDETGEAVQF
ncbi:hypothetical protein BU15DRAFT_65733 [Melanogaster broomeanus]|nr:hypothetical protein BU15DRAFT_65733 [Melanogaster broomeanus]